MTDQTTVPRTDGQGIDWIWKWGITGRLTGITLFCSLFLPWCSDLRGIDFLKMEGLYYFWLFPVGALILILLPFWGVGLSRFLIELFTTLGLTVGSIYLSLRFRTLRGLGLELATFASGFGLLGAVVGLYWQRFIGRYRPKKPNQEDMDHHS